MFSRDITFRIHSGDCAVFRALFSSCLPFLTPLCSSLNIICITSLFQAWITTYSCSPASYFPNTYYSGSYKLRFPLSVYNIDLRRESCSYLHIVIILLQSPQVFKKSSSTFYFWSRRVNARLQICHLRNDAIASPLVFGAQNALLADINLFGESHGCFAISVVLICLIYYLPKCRRDISFILI